MVDWGRVLAGATGGGVKGALDYDATVKQDARETRRDDAIAKRQMSLAKYTTGAAAERQTELIASTEDIAAKRITASTEESEASRMAQVAENKRQEGIQPSGWVDGAGTPITKAQLESANPEEKKGWITPKAQIKKLASIKAAEKKLEFQRDIVLKKVESGKSATAGPKDLQKTLLDMEKAFMFEDTDTPAIKREKAKEYMRGIGWTGSLIETTIKPVAAPGGLSAIDVAMKKKLGTPPAVVKPPGSPIQPPSTPQVGALDTPGSFEKSPLGRVEAAVKTIPGALKRAEVTNAEALERLKTGRRQGSLIPGVGTFKR